MNTRIPLPKLLDADMNESRRISPAHVSISEKIKPLSFATITLKENEDIPARSYFKLYTRNGESGNPMAVPGPQLSWSMPQRRSATIWSGKSSKPK